MNPFLSQFMPQVSYQNVFEAGSSFFLVLGAGFLELIAKFYQLRDKSISNYLQTTLSKIINQLIQKFPQFRDNFNFYLGLFSIITTGAPNLKQAFDWIKAYASHPEYKVHIEKTVHQVISCYCPEVFNWPSNPINYNSIVSILSRLKDVLNIKFIILFNAKQEFENPSVTELPILILSINQQFQISICYGSEIQSVMSGFFVDFETELKKDHVLKTRIQIPNQKSNEIGRNDSKNSTESPTKVYPKVKSDSIPNLCSQSYPELESYHEKDHISNRTHISKLSIEKNIISQLACNYCHCIGIGIEKNQTRAFAVAFKNLLELSSNKEFKKGSLEKLLNNPAVVSLKLEKFLKFSKLTVKKIVKNFSSLFEILIPNLNLFDEEMARKFEHKNKKNIDTKESENCLEIKLLSKFFGISAVIIKVAGKEAVIKKFNLPKKNSRPEVHFIGIKGKKSKYHFHVLITNSQNFEDGYDEVFSNRDKNPHAIVIKQVFCNEEKQPQLENVSPINETYETLKKISSLTLDPSILSNLPINSQVDIHRFLKKLKESEQELMKNPNFAKIQPFDTSFANNFSENCRFCGNPNPEFVHNFGCYYHENCLAMALQNYLRQPNPGPLSSQSFPCKNCQKPLEVLKLLDTQTLSVYKSYLKNIFDNTFICEICSKEKKMYEREGLHERCESFYCKDCICLNSITGGYRCKCGTNLYLDLGEYIYTCRKCKVQTLLCNFLEIEILEGLCCKRCWLQHFIENGHYLPPNNFDMNLLLNFFNSENKICKGCGDETLRLRAYTDNQCSGLCLCFDHSKSISKGEQCPCCGEEIGVNKIQWSAVVS